MSTGRKQRETIHKDDPAQLSKRKKQTENMTGKQKLSEKPKFEWTQSSEDLTIRVKALGIKENQLKDMDVQFADNDVTVKLPDGRLWVWNLVADIYRERSRVNVKKHGKSHMITLHMKKKKSTPWEQLEAEPIVAETDIPDESQPISVSQAQQPTNQQQDNKETSDPGELDIDINEPQLDHNESQYRQEIPQGESNEEQEATQNNLESTCIKEEEPVVELQHIKHDFIDKDNEIVVHVYVKEVNKDNLMVSFGEDNIRVKFQTSNKQFLNLHTDSTEETKFSWHIQLRDLAVPGKCQYKLKSSLIELCIAKKELRRWPDLEALKRAAQPVVSGKTNDWVSVQGVETKSSEDKGTSNQLSESEPKAGSSSQHQMGASEEPKPTEQKTEKDKLENQSQNAAGTSSASREYIQQKPTAKVQPLYKREEMSRDTAVTPGFTGLDNLGNTCFMSGVVQCLANTREFRDFFLSGDFQHDLNLDNVLGSGGKLAVQFALLCKVLWSGNHFSYPPSKLKNLVAQKASQFTGFAQHDSQEFMAFLLDGLHEDLNRVRKKPYTETVEDEGRPDEVVADEAWAIHKKRNDSFIVDLFQGQYKSKLICPVCKKVSITFDPFLYLSLPLPKRQRLLPVTVMWKDPHKKPVRYMLRLSKEAAVEALKEAVYKKTGINPQNMRVFEACKGKIYKTFHRGYSLANVAANDNIIVCEILSEDLAGETVHEITVFQRTLMPNQFPTKCSSCRKLCPEGSKLKRCSKCFKVGYCDQTCQKNHWQLHKSACKCSPDPVGTPFILSVPESRATFSKICQLMEAYARYSIELFQPPVKSEPAQTLTSHLSSSNLSSSSQSSGSLNSLDSQSSFSSSCTITAQQDQQLDDLDSPVQENAPRMPAADDTMSLPGSDCDSFPEKLTGSKVNDNAEAKEEMGPKDTNLSPGSPEQNVISTDAKKTVEAGKSVSFDSGYSSMADLQAGQTKTPGVKLETTEKESQPHVRSVLGVQTSDLERTTPMFFIKPVNREGVGLTGENGARLEDKGDQVLDLSHRPCFSMDWKNNDKLPGYVLVQSKEMEVQNDESMMTASLEESNITLEQCLELFTEAEILSPEEAWYCPSCKTHREASKQLSTWRLPHTLIIQLKRFSFRNFIWRDKIDKMVEFPTRGLDLSHYYAGSQPSGASPPVYDLYGVVNHHGGILGGHYTSYVRCGDLVDPCKNEVGWRLCDDSRVCSVSHEKNVVTRGAYLLFYRKRQVFVPVVPTAISSEPSDDDDEAFQSAQSDNEDYIENQSGSGIMDNQSGSGIIDNQSGSGIMDNQSGSDNQGRLLIDTSSEDELPDLMESSRGQVILESNNLEADTTSMLSTEDPRTLGYTDMDSVD